MRSILRSKHAEQGFIAAVVTLIAVMFATIIAATVLFAFTDAGNTATDYSETQSVTGANATKFYFSLSDYPATSNPNWVVVCHGSKGAKDFTLTSANYTYVSANNTIWVNKIGKYNTSIDFTYNTLAYDQVVHVNTYAIIVFAMLAILPIVIVGGLMMRSLGFFSGGGGKP